MGASAARSLQLTDGTALSVAMPQTQRVPRQSRSFGGDEGKGGSVGGAWPSSPPLRRSSSKRPRRRAAGALWGAVISMFLQQAIILIAGRIDVETAPSIALDLI